MNNKEFEQFVLDNGKEILRFCRMTCADREAGDELYQDTMLKLLSKMRSLDLGQNVGSYALSVSILLWKNKKKKYANRSRLIPMESMDRLEAEGNLEIAGLSEASPENCILMEDERIVVQQVVARLPEKYRIPVYLFYSAELSIQEIAKVLQIPAGTVKSRMNKAKHVLKEELEALGYDR